ncbi:GGDEF domain-containing protein [Pseudomonas sp. Gutcm_11s]|uniref:GGDEF domain-containing protein n=1 Tax=Pseudomonas sp. Gutcm_11s TaxID=3026088 RepID=UPI00236038CC|nr:GGDEF domain-containing protein [Pseudomonas sp. Gutcm_11s]MDD0844114.1 GGDEF domain-containing protein [Pseudomonas sp. Gutcm_11s]
MTLIEKLQRLLDPLHGMPEATRQEFACWYSQAKLPQIRSVAFLTMVLYLIYAAIEQNVAQDHLGLRLLAHGILVPLALLAVGVASYFPAWHRWMLAILCVAPVSAVLTNLAFNRGSPDFAYFVPEIYLNLMWTFTVSGLTLRQATLTASCSALVLIALTLVDALQPGAHRLHFIWVLAAFSFGLLCAMVLEKAHKTMFLDQGRLALSASIDGLTGLWNRARIDQLFIEEIARAQRYGTPFSVILLDIDHFKHVNDHHGHAVGDSVLRQFAALLRDNVRTSDKVGRLGGEEFLIILPEIDAAQAQAAAHTLQARIRQFDFDTVLRKTASFGITQFRGDESPQHMLDRADRALYKAKAGGRDRIEVH